MIILVYGGVKKERGKVCFGDTEETRASRGRYQERSWAEGRAAVLQNRTAANDLHNPWENRGSELGVRSGWIPDLHRKGFLIFV